MMASTDVAVRAAYSRGLEAGARLGLVLQHCTKQGVARISFSVHGQTLSSLTIHDEQLGIGSVKDRGQLIYMIGSALGLAAEQKRIPDNLVYRWQSCATIRGRQPTALEAWCQGVLIIVLDAQVWAERPLRCIDPRCVQLNLPGNLKTCGWKDNSRAGKVWASVCGAHACNARGFSQRHRADSFPLSQGLGPEHTVYVCRKKRKCGNAACGGVTVNDDQLLDQLPAGIQNEFIAELSDRSGCIAAY